MTYFIIKNCTYPSKTTTKWDGKKTYHPLQSKKELERLTYNNIGNTTKKWEKIRRGKSATQVCVWWSYFTVSGAFHITKTKKLPNNSTQFSFLLFPCLFSILLLEMKKLLQSYFCLRAEGSTQQGILFHSIT